MTENNFDVLIIGAGQAAIPHDLAKAGRHVALVEEKHLGGSCVNFGCTPTKAVIASAHVAHLARRAIDFGLRIPAVEIDFPAVLARARRILMESRNGLQRDLKDTDNPKLFIGYARFEGRDDGAFRVAVGNRVIVAVRMAENVAQRKTYATFINCSVRRFIGICGPGL